LRTVAKAFLRYLPRRRALSALQLLGIAFGIASAVGMALSARAALLSFSRAVEFLEGRATHNLARPAGPLEESFLRRLMVDPAVLAFSPVIDRRVRLPSDELVRVLGIDPFLDRPFRAQLAPPEGATTPFLFEERTVLADASLAERLELARGGSVETSHGRLEVVGTFPNPAGEPILLMDIGHAQELFDLRGRVDRVDLILDDPEGFRSRWGHGFRIRSARQSQAALGQMLRAFRLNLEALSLLGLFVGVFLVYNTAMFAVVSRTKDTGILLSLGSERREIAAAFVAELLILGGLGGFLGAVLGYGLSRFLTDLVGGAISSIYFFLRPAPPEWSWGIAAAGVGLGWGACLLGGFFPLVELVRVDPVRALRGRVHDRSSRSRTRKAGVAGLGVVALSVALFPTASLHVYIGFAGAFGLIVGASLLVGVALDTMGPGIERLCGGLAGLPGKVAAGNIRRNLGRTAVAVAAFMVALSMSVGLGLMIGSFRETLIWWMETQLTGEVYVAPSVEVQVPQDLYEELRNLAGIGGVDPYRSVKILYADVPVYLSAISAEVLQRYARFAWVRGGSESWEAVKRGAVIVSESFSRRFGVGKGNEWELVGVDGPVVLPIAGVFYDYTTEHGLIMMDRSTYLRIYEDPTINSVGIFLDPGNPDNQRVLDEVRARASLQGIPVMTREELHGNILEVFDSTFAVTRSMRVIAVVVAFFGIAGALLTLYMERQREFGIYRALGFSTPQVAVMTLMEGLGMGAASFVLCLVVGTALAFVLIWVINLRSFNWTIFFHPDWRPYLTAAATAAAASLGAAAYPIWRICRTFPQMQIREE
jgi:putative ABC transport system permease protein